MANRVVPDMTDLRMGRIAMGKLKSQHLCGLVDIDAEQGQRILDSIDEANIPSGIAVTVCEKLPEIVEDSRSTEAKGTWRGSAGGPHRDGQRSFGASSRGYSPGDKSRAPYSGGRYVYISVCVHLYVYSFICLYIYICMYVFLYD